MTGDERLIAVRPALRRDSGRIALAVHLIDPAGHDRSRSQDPFLGNDVAGSPCDLHPLRRGRQADFGKQPYRLCHRISGVEPHDEGTRRGHDPLNVLEAPLGQGQICSSGCQPTSLQLFLRRRVGHSRRFQVIGRVPVRPHRRRCLRRDEVEERKDTTRWDIGQREIDLLPGLP